jgi:hypothetical protein
MADIFQLRASVNACICCLQQPGKGGCEFGKTFAHR